MSPVDKHRPSQSPEIDPSTFSNYQLFAYGSTDLQFKVDFDKKIVSGEVQYHLTKVVATTEIVLDTSFLTIHSITVNDAPITDYQLAARVEPLGSKLTIPLHEDSATIKLVLTFETTENCTALQFLDKEATDGKKYPYLFSQCQAIHARSLYPSFDTPSVKTAYKLKVESPYPSLMSGRPTKVEDNVYYFDQPIPIPSYLMSLASGDITSAPIGPRSHVYCEPIKIDQCQYEFENDMENFIQTAESIVFDYEWQQYNALVLPLSFPYGGMENPNITFATPTLISGDRENVDVLAHELAHSWSGNLVTNCSWEHFWLNEGWTVYLERRIQGKLHGSATRDFSAIIGWNDLENSINAMGDSAERYSTLVQDLKDRSDPDDAFSTVPYEKGSNLLYHIETVLGGIEKFDPFIPHYFNKFKYKSLDTYEFLDTLYAFFPEDKDKLDGIDWETWLYKPGMPPIKPDFDASLVEECYNLADKWYNAVTNKQSLEGIFHKDDISKFSANQSVVFLDTLNSFNKIKNFKWAIYQPALLKLSEVYSAYSKSANCEVLFRWYLLQVGGHNQIFYNKLGEWLGTVGRMKFVRPGYVLLNEVDHDLAIHYFKKFEAGYHPICRAMVKKDLGL